LHLGADSSHYLRHQTQIAFLYSNNRMELLHFSAVFDRPLNHPTLFSRARGIKTKPLGGSELSFLFTSQQCHGHSIYLNVVNRTAEDLGVLLLILVKVPKALFDY